MVFRPMLATTGLFIPSTLTAVYKTGVWATQDGDNIRLRLRPRSSINVFCMYAVTQRQLRKPLTIDTIRTVELPKHYGNSAITTRCCLHVPMK